MKRTLTLGMTLALPIFAFACSGDEADPAPTTGADQPAGTEDTTPTTEADQGGGSEASITISGFAFTGAETVSIGDTVTITNEDAAGHTWTAVDGEFDSGTLAEGETFDFTFDAAGDFDYFCSIHPSMTGTITVEG